MNYLLQISLFCLCTSVTAQSVASGSPGHPSCTICGDGSVVGSVDTMVQFEGQAPLTCAALELLGLQGYIEEVFCPTMPSLISEPCNCTLASSTTTTEAPVATSTTSSPVATTPAPVSTTDSPLSMTVTAPVTSSTLAPVSSSPAPFFLADNNDNELCIAVEKCNNLEGACCPTSVGVDRFCCNSTEASCSVHPKCKEQGLLDNCCPTADGVYLDCCEKPFGSCSVHPGCAHLDGDCCPTPSGVFLDCCEDDQPAQRANFETIPDRAMCSSNSACTNLEGDCCPTTDGIFLFCCGNTDEKCETHPTCDGLGLAGACCPTVDGVYLDCCERDFASPDAHPECTGEEDTCPGPDGEFDSCCLDDQVAKKLSFAKSSDPVVASPSTTPPEIDLVAPTTTSGACMMRWIIIAGAAIIFTTGKLL